MAVTRPLIAAGPIERAFKPARRPGSIRASFPRPPPARAGAAPSGRARASERTRAEDVAIGFSMEPPPDRRMGKGKQQPRFGWLVYCRGGAVLSCRAMRKVHAPALALGLLALALAVLAPAFAAAGTAPDCGMSCCRLGMPTSHAGMPDCGGHARCSVRGCGGGTPAAALSALPPTVLPALPAL